MTLTAREETFSPRQVLLTPGQVAEWLGLSEEALSQLRYTGKGPVFRRLTAKTIRYAESDVEAFIDASARTITGQVA